MKLYYRLTTVDPVILSQSIATTNNHQGLDYIPGSAMLGLVASKLYGGLSEQESWQVFHSGAVQFGNAYADMNGEVCLPLPASWHYEKGQSTAKDGQLSTDVVNHANGDVDSTKQYKQCRGGYVSQSGLMANIKQGMVTKTALERTGLVKDGSLYSYTYIDKNQSFIGSIECTDESQRQMIAQALDGDLRLGRSRGSEFGRVQIELLESVTPSPVSVSSTITLWCLSDCQCIDKLGLPTYTPALSDLVAGATGTFNREKSFIRSHKATRFNQARGGFDSEQLVIAKGSVLVFDDVSMTQAQLEQLRDTGMGLNRQQGLGSVMINPLWSQSSNFMAENLFESAVFTLPKPKATVVPATAQTSPLIAWIERNTQAHQATQVAKYAAKQAIAKIIKAYRDARQYNRILHTYEAGPSSSQWRRIDELVRRGDANWHTKLFTQHEDDKSAICRAENDELGWGLAWDNGERFISFADHFKENILADKDIKADIAVMRQLTEWLCRYDLSVYCELKKAERELQLPTSKKQESEA
ncbi:hypothetical protein [Photobacterium toruni]|uniref:RAMP superfamily protein n=1 Tax=Photobacterium toruni TaxID=1935446 RepID=A0A1T4UH81_9GAMM|nr:hypothetical protein [Photobacterium toruni]SKA51878.1 hypothetical protein CZ814_03233 [Photobacterium toruni]